jgi:hypothetical protein
MIPFDMHGLQYTTHSLSGGPAGFQESDGSKLQAKRTKCERKESRGQQAQARTGDWRLRLGRSLRVAEFDEHCGIKYGGARRHTPD